MFIQLKSKHESCLLVLSSDFCIFPLTIYIHIRYLLTSSVQLFDFKTVQQKFQLSAVHLSTNHSTGLQFQQQSTVLELYEGATERNHMSSA